MKRLSASPLGYPLLCSRWRTVSPAASIAKRSNLPPSRTGRSRTIRPLSGTESSPRTTKDLSIIGGRSEEHTSELQSQSNLVCRLLLEKKKKKTLRNMNEIMQTKELAILANVNTHM